MDFNERLAQTQAKMDELKANINKTAEDSKEARNLKKEEIMSKMSDVDKAIEKFADDVEDVVNTVLDESGEIIEDFADNVEEGVNNTLDSASESISGTANAASENARIAKEKRDSKLNSLRLQLQMNKEAMQDKITAKKEAKDKASQEKRIIELLDYADKCQDATLAMALETEAAVLEAAAEIADYNEKYGDA
ncbi:MAG: hypothetical protein K5644_07340 [Lachnospiraceae bacterium]|nr:hypothetical protein [Lachnospiraceae bacterium]